MLNIGNVVLQRVQRGGANDLHGAYKRFAAVLDEFRSLLGSISKCEMDLRGNSGILQAVEGAAQQKSLTNNLHL